MEKALSFVRRFTTNKISNCAGFSLVEVVLSLAIFVFAGFALVGLISTGLQSRGDATERFQAATIAEIICSTRRAAPTADFTATGNPQINFPLPNLSISKNNISTLNPVYLTWSGKMVASGLSTDPTARFGLLYSITAPSNYVPSINPGVSVVYMYIFWPAQAQPTSGSASHLDLTTSFALP